MDIERIKGGRSRVEHGYQLSRTDQYRVILTKDEVSGKSMELLFQAIEEKDDFKDYAEVSVTLSEKLKTGGYLFNVDATLLNAAQNEQNFRFVYRSGLMSEVRGTDLYGMLNTVQYPGQPDEGEDVTGADIRTALVDVTLPVVYITASGIRDLGSSGYTAQSLPLEWVNTVNSATWRSNPPRSVKCTGCNLEPVYFKDKKQVWRITLEFTAIPKPSYSDDNMQWQGAQDPWIYWADSSGRVPGDDEQYLFGEATDYDKSYRQTHQYLGVDYNGKYPLGNLDDDDD